MATTFPVAAPLRFTHQVRDAGRGRPPGRVALGASKLAAAGGRSLGAQFFTLTPLLCAAILRRARLCASMGRDCSPCFQSRRRSYSSALPQASLCALRQRPTVGRRTCGRQAPLLGSLHRLH